MLSRSHDSICRDPPVTSWRHTSASRDRSHGSLRNLRLCFDGPEGVRVRVTVNHHYEHIYLKFLNMCSSSLYKIPGI